jgi:hypothetical protein
MHAHPRQTLALPPPEAPPPHLCPIPPWRPPTPWTRPPAGQAGAPQAALRRISALIGHLRDGELAAAWGAAQALPPGGERAVGLARVAAAAGDPASLAHHLSAAQGAGHPDALALAVQLGAPPPPGALDRWGAEAPGWWLADACADAAVQQLQSGDAASATAWLERGLEHRPGHAELHALQRRIADRSPELGDLRPDPGLGRISAARWARRCAPSLREAPAPPGSALAGLQADGVRTRAVRSADGHRRDAEGGPAEALERGIDDLLARVDEAREAGPIATRLWCAAGRAPEHQAPVAEALIVLALHAPRPWPAALAAADHLIDAHGPLPRLRALRARVLAGLGLVAEARREARAALSGPPPGVVEADLALRALAEAGDPEGARAARRALHRAGPLRGRMAEGPAWVPLLPRLADGGLR